MLIKMLTTAAGQEYVYFDGKEYSVDDTIAKQFIKGGYAREVTQNADNLDKSETITANK